MPGDFTPPMDFVQGDSIWSDPAVEDWGAVDALEAQVEADYIARLEAAYVAFLADIDSKETDDTGSDGPDRDDSDARQAA